MPCFNFDIIYKYLVLFLDVLLYQKWFIISFYILSILVYNVLPISVIGCCDAIGMQSINITTLDCTNFLLYL